VAGGAYSASPDPLAALKGPTSKGRERREREREGREREGRRERVKGGREGEGAKKRRGRAGRGGKRNLAHKTFRTLRRDWWRAWPCGKGRRGRKRRVCLTPTFKYLLRSL